MSLLPSPGPYADAEELAEFASDTARRAGRQLMKRLACGRYQGDVESKSGRELVSQADRASQQLILDALAVDFPDHAVYAEEAGEARTAGDASRRWIIDPLDGTTNFLCGLPIFCVSMAVERLVEGERPHEAPDLVAGCIHLPYLDETFLAIRNRGAFLNSRSIELSVSDTDELSEAVVATGFSYHRERFPNYDNFLRLAKAARGIRRMGAAAVDLAYIAAGRFDAFWELGLGSHDVAAGALLAQEAGGRVSDFEGGDSWLEGRRIIATNGRLHEAVMERVSR